MTGVQTCALPIFGGTPSGRNTQVQFNNNGSFGANAGLTFNFATTTLTTNNFTVSSTANLGSVSNLTITGGTGPYFYSGSNGTFVVTYSQTYEFSGLNAGPFSVLITDAALCKIQLDTVLQTPNSFYSVQVDTTNSFCGNSDGIINVSVIGGSVPYTYTLVKPDSNTISFTSNLQNQSFIGLETGDYTVFITDGGGCTYSQDVSIIAENKYTVTT